MELSQEQHLADNQAIEQYLDNSQVLQPNIKETRKIAGFWRRLAAFMVDSILMGLFGMLLGIFLFDFFASLGPWGRILGFSIALMYFGTFNSAIGNGQTLGKRLLKIKVVNKKGLTISFLRSMLRYSIFALPFFLNNWWIPIPSGLYIVIYIFSILIFGIGASTVYLFIFNRRTRQSLHDLLLGTYVVKSISEGEVQSRPVWRFHYGLVGIFCLGALVVPVLSSQFVQNTFLKDLLELQQAVQSHEKVHNATAYIGKNWFISNGQRLETSYFRSQVNWKEKPADYEAAAKEIALIVFEKYPEALTKDRVVIMIMYGYDIGIASAWNNQSFVYPPSTWMEKLDDEVQEL